MSIQTKIIGWLLLLFIFLGIFSSASVFAASHPDDANHTNTQSAKTQADKPIDANYSLTTPKTIDVNKFAEFSSDITVGGFAQRVLTFLMAILGGVAMLGIIAGGIMVMSGGVSETTKEQGKDLLIYSIIGICVALLAMVIVTLAQTFFYSLGT